MRRLLIILFLLVACGTLFPSISAKDSIGLDSKFQVVVVNDSLFIRNMVTDDSVLMSHRNNIQLALPDTVYMSQGHEQYIYWNNVIQTMNYQDYLYDAVVDSGDQFAQGWAWTPVSGLGDYSFTLDVYTKDFIKIASESTVLHVATGDTVPGDSSWNILCIGDSWCDGNVWTGELGDLGGDSLVFIGTRDTGTDSPNEGYGGMYYQWFEANASSPFVNPSGHVDFATYLSDNLLDTPDWVIIELGINDIFYATQTNYESFVSDYLGTWFTSMADSLINAIKRDIPDAKIGLCCCPMPAFSQDAFGNNYDVRFTTFHHKRKAHWFNRRMYEYYGIGGDGTQNNVFIVPINLGIDTEHNFPTTSTPFNSRTTDEYDRQMNGVHPANSGYYQTADQVYGWIKRLFD